MRLEHSTGLPASVQTLLLPQEFFLKATYTCGGLTSDRDNGSVLLISLHAHNCLGKGWFQGIGTTFSEARRAGLT